MEEIKRFSQLSDLDEKKQLDFGSFEKLNKILENLGANNNSKIFYDSYYKVLLDIGNKNIDFFNYSELDFQIKYLIEEKKVAVNRILEFISEKFNSLDIILKNILKNSDLFNPIHNFSGFIAISHGQDNILDKLVRDILKLKKGDLLIQFKEINGNGNRTYFINFDFSSGVDLEENIKKFNLDLKDINFEEIHKETGMLPYGFGIKG